MRSSECSDASAMVDSVRSAWEKPSDSGQTKTSGWAIAGACLLMVVLLAVMLAAGIRATSSTSWHGNGDSVGQQNGESFAAYVDRADVSLANAPEDDEAFALITFPQAVDVETAADLLSPLQRVSAVVPAELAPVAIPEPVAGATRADVFRTAFERMSARAALSGLTSVDPTIVSVVVWDTGGELRALREDAGESIAAIDVLPTDAYWGGFGVLPVYPEA